MSNDPKNEGLPPVRSDTAAIGLSRLAHVGLPTEADREAALELAIRDLVRKDARHNPQALMPPPAQGKAGSGWQDEKPLSVPMGQEAIGKLCDAALGPAVPKKAKEEQ